MKKLILSIAVTFTSLLVCLFTAFAWFSNNDTVTAEDAMVSVSTSDKIKRLDPTVYSLTNTANGYVKGSEITELNPFNGDLLTTALIQVDYEVTEPGYYTLDLGYTGVMYNYSDIIYINDSTPIVTFLSNALGFWDVKINNVNSDIYFQKDGVSETFLHLNSTTEHFDKDISDWRVTGNALRIGIDENGDPVDNPTLTGTAYIIIDYSETLINELYTAILNNAQGGNITGATFDFTGDLIVKMNAGSDNDWVVPNVYYTLNFNGNGGTGSVDSITALSTLSVQLPQTGFSKVNNFLVGWNTAADGSGASFNLGQTYPVSTFAQYAQDNNITLYAVWNASAYTIRYNSNEGLGSISNQIAPTSGNVTLATSGFSREFYKLSGWNTAADGSGTNFTLGQSPDVTDLGLDTNNTTVTLYAMWTDNYYTVQFDKNSSDATGTMENQKIDIDRATALTKNGFVRSGYAFAGWNTAADGSGTTYTNQEVISGLATSNGATVTLYAMWSESVYRVQFNANGGTGSMAIQSLEVGKNETLNSNTFTYTKHVFVGWNTAANGSGTSYANEAIVKDIAGLNETITLYAQWKESFTISFTDSTFNTVVASRSDLIEIPDDLAELNKTGYHFFGWYTNPELTTKAVPGTELNADLELFAKWQRIIIKDDFSTGSDILTGYQGKAAHQSSIPWDEGINLYVKHKTSSTDDIAQNYSSYTESNSDENNNYISYSDGAYTLIDNNSVLATIAYINFDEAIDKDTVYGSFDFTFTETVNNNWAFFSVMGSYAGAYGELFAIRIDANNIFQYRIHDSADRITINESLTAVQNQAYTIEFEINLSTGKVDLYVTTLGTTYSVTFTDTNFNAISALSLSSSETGSKSVTFDNLLVTSTADLQPSVRVYDKLTGEKIDTLVISNGKVTLPNALSKTGYTWSGWQLANGTVVDNNTPFTGGEKVYGVLTPITYTIKFDNNGQVGLMDDQTFTYDQAQALSTCSFAHSEGNPFLGWSTTKGGSVVYSESQVVENLTTTNGDTITLYAVWAKE